MAGYAESLLKGQSTNVFFFFAATYPGYQQKEGRQSALESLEESLGLVATGRKLKEQPPRSCAESPPHCRSH